MQRPVPLPTSAPMGIDSPNVKSAGTRPTATPTAPPASTPHVAPAVPNVAAPTPAPTAVAWMQLFEAMSLTVAPTLLAFALV
mmetsp:Transcript_92836/g.179002  ORF Transcript_92836/g.179002 Transcript_92836/m.179002 type:complete len:82 (-) Transcript_92836:131-376(-)